MKNIYILPTDKPSPLFYFDKKLFYLPKEKDRTNWNKDLVKIQHIYITSDEEIKEGDWGLSKLNEVILFGRSYNEKFYKKIILTTDQDLIKDGVQAIDDEFLEWFVKNPSCESIQVNSWKVSPLVDDKIFGYKIIIPKEESKQETLEEVAERIYPITPNSHPNINWDILNKREGFTEGYKLAQEQNKNLYSEEEVLELLEKRTNYVLNPNSFFTGVRQWFEQFKKK